MALWISFVNHYNLPRYYDVLWLSPKIEADFSTMNINWPPAWSSWNVALAAFWHSFDRIYRPFVWNVHECEAGHHHRLFGRHHHDHTQHRHNKTHNYVKSGLFFTLIVIFICISIHVHQVFPLITDDVKCKAYAQYTLW
jgi:hypothetical protein